MAYVDLDKVINVGSWGGGGIYPDVPYPVLAQRIAIFNKPNARDTDSNGWFGLMWNSVNGICWQNYNFNQQIALAVDSGVAALATRVKSYDFSTNIDKLDVGQIKFWLMTRGTKFFSINQSTKKIEDVYMSALDQTLTFNSNSKRSWIVTSWGNRFMLVWKTAANWVNWTHTITDVFPIDANNRITSYTPVDTFNWHVIAIVSNYIWTAYNNNDNFWSGKTNGKLFSINSSWATTEISSVNLRTWAYYFNLNFASYQQDNTVAHFIQTQRDTGPNYNFKYLTIDLTNTSTFTFTSVYTVWSNIAYVRGVWWYDWSWFLMVSWTNVKRVTAWWISASLWTYCVSANDTMAINSDLSYFTSLGDTICTNSTAFNILGTIPTGIVTAMYNNMSFVFEPTAALSQDDSFVGVMTNYAVIGSTDPVVSEVNWVQNNIIDNGIYTNDYWIIMPVTVQSLVNSYVDLELSIANTLWNDLNLWIGITGGTYATPTLPSNNWLSGSSTTARTAGTDSSYINLTLSTI